MKKIALAMAVLAMSGTAFAQKTGGEMGKTKTLVAWFSATGTTEKAAEIIAEVTGGDMHEIRPAEEYTAADLDWRDRESRSSRENADPASRPEIVKDLGNVDGYDTIYIGYPIWWNVAPRVINTFIETYGFEGKTVIPFATSGGSTISNSVKVLRETYPGIRWQEGRLLNGASESSVRQWLGR